MLALLLPLPIRKENQFLMKCIKNESVQIYTERAEQVKREKIVAAMLYSCHCLEVCFILVTNDTQPVDRLDPLGGHSLHVEEEAWKYLAIPHTNN